VAAVVAALGAGVALGRLERIAEFAATHTTTTLAAIAIAATATALVTAVSLADQRPR
jgi:hypothetical protein